MGWKSGTQKPNTIDFKNLKSAYTGVQERGVAGLAGDLEEYVWGDERLLGLWTGTLGREGVWVGGV